MSSQISHDHHTVPKLYLRGFCGRKGPDKSILLARRRDGSEQRLTVKQATVEADFYDVGEDGEPDDTLERWFDRMVETPVGPLMVELRRGILPTAQLARATLAVFVAVQMVRTTAFRHLMEDMSSHLGPNIFASTVLQRAIDEDPSLKQDEQEFTALHRQIANRAPQSVRRADKKSMMRNMVREADRLKPLLGAMTWMLVSSDEPLLLTGDSPVVTVNGTGEISFTPMLLPDLHEVYVPITPHTLLTVTSIHSLASNPVLSREQANVVNQAIVRSCTNTVLRRPDMVWPSDLVLPRARARLAPPRVTVTPSSGQATTTPTWPPVIDRAMAEALEVLGGDPDL